MARTENSTKWRDRNPKFLMEKKLLSWKMCSPLFFWVSFLFYFEGQVLFGFLCFHFLPFFSSCLEYCLDWLHQFLVVPRPAGVWLQCILQCWSHSESLLLWVHFGPHPFLSSSLCYFRVFKALFFVNSPAFMNLNNLTFPAKKKKTINETAQPCQTDLVTMVIFLHIFCHTQPWVSSFAFLV